MTNTSSQLQSPMYPLTIHKVTYGPVILTFGRQRFTTRHVTIDVDEGWGGGAFRYKLGHVEFGRSRLVELQPEKPWWRFWQ